MLLATKNTEVGAAISKFLQNTWNELWKRHSEGEARFLEEIMKDDVFNTFQRNRGSSALKIFY